MSGPFPSGVGIGDQWVREALDGPYSLETSGIHNAFSCRRPRRLVKRLFSGSDHDPGGTVVVSGG